MGQSFDLGFQIDTTSLKRAGDEAIRSADNVAKLGDAERKLAGEAQKTGEALKKETQATQEAATKKQQLAEQTTTLTGKLRMQQQDVQNLAAAFRGQQGLVGGIDAAATSATRLLGGLGPLTIGLGLAAIGIGVLAKVGWELGQSLGQAQDKLVGLEARLKSALGSTEAARSAMKALYDQTQQTGLGFSSAADAFTRVARNNSAIGLTQTEMLQMAETVQKLGAASGASQGEMTGAMVQFGQALASGRLQGDELRSIMENLPPLAKAIADNFEKADGTIGITIGTLRKMGSEGELTSGKIAEAVLRATDKARKEFETLPTTMAQSTQKMNDAWEMMLAKMGEKLNASGLIQSLGNAATGFINGITKALDGPTLDERIAKLQQAVREGRPTQEYSRVGNLARQEGTYGTTAAEREAMLKADREALDRALAERGRLWQAQAAQAFQEQQLKLIAPSSAAEAQTAEFAPITEKVKAAQNTVTNLQTAIDNLNQAIERGGSKDYDVATLTANRDRLLARMQAANAAVSAIMNEAGKFAQTINDAELARRIGGVQGGVSITTAAITQQRADQKTSSAGGLGSYIDLGIKNALVAANDELDNFSRKVTDARTQLTLVGKSVGESMRAQVAQETEAAKLQRFGTLDTDPMVSQAMREKILKWAADYSARLLEMKQALQDVQEEQAAFNAELEASLSARLANTALDERSQQDAKLADQIERMRTTQFGGDANDPEFIRTANAMRQKAADERLLSERMSNRELEKQLDLAARMRGIQGLTRDEYRVQAALMQKKLELEYQGVDAASDYYQRQLQLTEVLERGKIKDEKGTTQSRLVKAVDDGLDKIEGQFSNLWKNVFTNGVEEAANIFGKGMSDIILDISAQMMNELVYKPFEELIRAAVQAMANWAVRQIFGGGGTDIGASMGSSGRPTTGGFHFADGEVFNFAKGSTFANKVFDTPQLFKFANGAKIGQMAEAGPEAVMPLERGSDGKLGVRNYGGGQSERTEVNIYDQRSGGQAVEVQESRGGDGRRMISVTIREEHKRQLRQGAYDREMTNAYGAQRQIGKR